MLLWWTKRSLLPSSGVMKPKPFSSLNHLTVPCAMYFLHGVFRAASAVVAQRQPSASACTAFAGRVPGPNFAHRTTAAGCDASLQAGVLLAPKPHLYASADAKT